MRMCRRVAGAGGWVSLFAITLCGTGTALAAPGRTPGSFAVSQLGSATYSIPLWAPPGPRGVQPQVALVYNSQAGPGSEGVGWSLAGLSSIARCNRTIAQDGADAAVALTYSDRFCLDGKRLRITNDNLAAYGQDGTTYQTEIADFSLVTAHGSAGNGPKYFTLQARNGWTYEYGNTSDSFVASPAGTALEWMLDKVTDRAGNTMTLTWMGSNGNLSGTTLPAKISWTPLSYGSAQYSYTMLFNYQLLSTAQQAGYIAGTPLENFYQLTGIEIRNASNTDIKAYLLSYSLSPATGQELLSTLTECTDTSRSNCLAPTSMTYQPGQAGIPSSPGAISGSSARSFESFAFDLNGDGINDLLYYDTGTGALMVAFGSPSGYQAPLQTPITTDELAVGYIDGTATASILVAQSGAYVYYRWNGSAFSATAIGVSATNPGGIVPFPFLADVNGDGLADLIYTHAGGEMYVQLNDTANGVVQFNAPIDVGNTGTLLSGYPMQWVLSSLPGTGKFDFTGDGQADLLTSFSVSTPTGTQYFEGGLHFTGSSFTYAGNFLGGPSPPGSVVDVADYNGDGCMDVLYVSELVLSNCQGSTGATLTFPYLAIAGINWGGGAGRAVLVNEGGQIALYPVLGNTLGSLTSTGGIPYDPTKTYTVAPNPTGDGLEGLITFTPTYQGAGPIGYYLHRGAGQPPDLLSSVKRGGPKKRDNFRGSDKWISAG